MGRGLSHFIPASDEPPEAPPPILISGLQVAGSRQFVSALGDTDMLLPDLSPGQNQLQIDFIGLSFAPGEVLRYQYKLEGTDRDWGPPTEQRSVTYRLAPGRYKFLVRAVNSDDVPSANPAVIRFRILPPMWARWWFLTLVAIGLMLILYRFYRYRVARLLELERVRTRIATDLHDDIGSSLSRMAILSEVAKRRLRGTEQESVSILTDIAESARGVTDSMSDIVWAIDPRRDDLSNVVFRVRQFASDVLGAKGISWTLQAPAEFDKVKLNPPQRRHIFLIFKEAISNSARHADCNSVWLSLAIVHNQIIGEIRDDGRGLAVTSCQVASDRPGGHGLENMRTRAAQLGGRLTIDSSPGLGTSIKVEVPLKRTIA
jgi:two-component sensor histidine kinase